MVDGQVSRELAVSQTLFSYSWICVTALRGDIANMVIWIFAGVSERVTKSMSLVW